MICFARQGDTRLLNKWKSSRSSKSYRSDTGNVSLLNQLTDQYLYNHTDSALYFAKQALDLAQFQNNTIGQVSSLLNIGRVYYVKGNYISSLDAASKAMGTSNEINYQPGVAGSYQIMGLIYLIENRYDTALKNFQLALSIYTRLKDPGKSCKSYYNIGLCYGEMKQYDKSFFYLNKATEIATAAREYNLVSMALNRIGENYFRLKKYQLALGYYQRVIGSKNSSNWEVDFAFSGLAQVYYQLGQYNEAILNAKKGLDLSQKVGSEADKIRALEVLAQSYAAVKNYKLAYTYDKMFKQENDSLFNKEKDKEVNNLHFKQEMVYSAKLENTIKVKEQSIAFSKRLLLFRNLIAACVIIFIIVVVRSNRQKTALNKVLQKQNDSIALQKEEILKQKEALYQLNHTKDQLFSVISHDLRTPFATIVQVMDGMHSGDISTDELKEILDVFYRQVRQTNLMVNNLLVWAGTQQSGIKTDVVKLNINDVVNEVISVLIFFAKNKGITLHHNYETDKWALADLNHLRIVIQNLIGNAIKFTTEGGKVDVYYSEDEIYHAIHIKDSGVGIPPLKMEKLFRVTGREISGYGTNNESGAGIGLALVKQFVDADKGKLDVKSEPGHGSEFTVYLRKIT
ncbi:MAG: tetratricopeptide repeat-containing sensor histidine kinase [Mucilaginibacter sp.]